MKVREATDADLKDVLHLYLQIDPEARIGVDQAKELLKNLSSYPDYRLYVAERDGQVVGTFTLIVMHNLAHGGSPSGLVESVVVDAALRGQGIGAQMMGFARRVCREKGCYKMALSSNQKRERAHRFYDQLGFERHGYSFRVSP